MASSRAADSSSNGQNGNGNTQQQEDAPWTFGGVTGGSPFSQGAHHGIEFPTRERFAGAAGALAAGGGNIFYHASGSVITNPKIYVIWYGSWAASSCTETSTASTPGIINYFLQNVGPSTWNAINTTYYQTINGVPTYVPPTAQWSGCFVDSGSQGFTLDGYSTATPGLKKINDVVSNALNSNALGAADPNGIYFVLTSANVVVNGFMNSSLPNFCGYHDSLVNAATTVKFAFIGDAVTHIASCAGQTVASPNGNVSADAMASVIGHELVETVSDPLGNTWFDSARYENGDKCAWTFGTTTTLGTAQKNTTVGTRPYLIQQNLAANTNTCLMSAPPAAVAPTLKSFSPTSGKVGTSITLTGSSFTTATNVSFNGIIAPSFSINSDTSITVAVPVGATTGLVSVTNRNSTVNSSSSFTVPVSAPTISSFTPAFGPSITITGTNLLGATSVSFNGTVGTNVTVVSATSVTVTPPASGTSGKITITTPGGTSAASSATYYFPAAFAATTPISPTSSLVGATVTITGTNLLGATSVSFNGTNAVPTVATTGVSLTIKVPTGATTGPLTITTPAGSVTSAASFTVIPPAPTVTGFTPIFGSPITITGTNLLNASAILFNGIAGAITSVTSATSLTATAPAGGTSGKITVTTPGGTSAASSATYYFPAGAISAPSSAAVGATITITGTNLLGATAVNFVGTTTVSAAPASTATLTSLTVKVPTGATSGSITITTPAGVSAGAPISIAPTIASFTPNSGTRSATIVNTVTITGTNFLGATAVALTGVSNVTIKTITATTIAVTFSLPMTLATSTAAKFTVTTPAGSVTSTGIYSIT